MDVQAFREAMRLLRTRRFGTFCFASLLANIGTWAQQVAQPWLLLTLGASPLVIGLNAFAQGAPVWMLTLVGGWIADRADRRRVIAGFQSVQMLCPVLLVILIVTRTVEPWMIVTISLVVGLTDALSMPSFQSIVPSIVARQKIPTALALNATQFNLSRLLGPALAGLLMASIGPAACFAANALSYVPFIAVAVWILPSRARGGPFRIAQGGSAARSVAASVGAALRIPAVRETLLTVFTTGLLCGPLITFCPVLVKEVHGGGAGAFSLALALFGAGGLAGAGGLLFAGPGTDRGRICRVFAIAYAASTVTAGLSPWAWSVAPVMAAAGIAMTVSNTSANSRLQDAAPAALLGQSVSLYMLAIRGGTSLGNMLTGFGVEWLGARETFMLDGLAALGVLLYLGYRRPRRPDGGSALPA